MKKALILLSAIVMILASAMAVDAQTYDWYANHSYFFPYYGQPAQSIWNVKERVTEVREMQRSTIFDTPDIWRWKKTWRRHYRGITYHNGFMPWWPYY